jgi:hypothetical protein
VKWVNLWIKFRFKEKITVFLYSRLSVSATSTKCRCNFPRFPFYQVLTITRKGWIVYKRNTFFSSRVSVGLSLLCKHFKVAIFSSEKTFNSSKDFAFNFVTEELFLQAFLQWCHEKTLFLAEWKRNRWFVNQAMS